MCSLNDQLKSVITYFKNYFNRENNSLYFFLEKIDNLINLFFDEDNNMSF